MNPGGLTHVQTVAFLHLVLMSLNANGISFDVKMVKTAEQNRYCLACVGLFFVNFHNVKKRNYPYSWDGQPTKEDLTLHGNRESRISEVQSLDLIYYKLQFIILK